MYTYLYIYFCIAYINMLSILYYFSYSHLHQTTIESFYSIYLNLHICLYRERYHLDWYYHVKCAILQCCKREV